MRYLLLLPLLFSLGCGTDPAPLSIYTEDEAEQQIVLEVETPAVGVTENQRQGFLLGYMNSCLQRKSSKKKKNCAAEALVAVDTYFPL